MRKIIYFDIDGTIVSDDDRHIILESTKNAMKKLHENGIYTVINTGRTRFNINEDIDSLGFDGYICGCGTFIEMNNKVLLYKTIPADECMDIVNLVRECNASPLYERKDTFFFDNHTRNLGGLLKLKQLYEKQGKDVSNTTDNENFSFDKFVIWYDEKSDIDSFKKGIEGKFDFIDRGKDVDSFFAEMVPCGYSKGTGIKYMNDLLEINYEDTYAAGDSLNDLPMLQAVKHPIVIGKNSPLVSYNFYNSDDFDDDGLSNAFKHFSLI